LSGYTYSTNSLGKTIRISTYNQQSGIILLDSGAIFEEILYTVNPLIEPPGALYFNLLFWKKWFNKNAINSHFSFFFGLASKGGSNTGFTN
jgi:hypothetical protein